jgi:uncharacterized protein YsxB (DUF464 family)
MHKADLEKLKTSKEGALQEVSEKFRRQMEELEKRYKQEIT